MDSIKIRNIKIDDYEGIKAYITDVKVTKYLTWQRYKNENTIVEYFHKIFKTNCFPDQTLVIDYNNRAIGTVHFILRDNACTQFGFGISSKYWNNGVGDAVVKLSLKYFLESDWRKNSQIVWADVHSLNKYAIIILLKNGFSLLKKSIEDNRDRYYIHYE